MKNVFLILAAVVAGYIGYVTWINRTPPSTPPVTTAETTSEPEASPLPPPLTVPAVTPPPRRLAAEGTYYLAQELSVTTDSGVTHLAPGTEVHRIGDGPGVIVVQCRDGTKFSAHPAQLTNDLDAATRIIFTYNSGLRSLDEFRTQQAASNQSQQQQQPEPIPRPAADGGATAGQDARVAQIQNQIASHRADIQRLEKEIGSASPHTRAEIGRVLQPRMDQDQNQINALQQQLQAFGNTGARLQ